jgi:hypothetical protein
MARANIFVNTPAETTYFYQDLDQTGERVNAGLVAVECHQVNGSGVRELTDQR